MKTIVYDGNNSFSALRSGFEDRGIVSIVTTTPEDCLRAFIQHAEAEAIIVIVDGDGVMPVRSLLRRLSEVNPMFGCYCIWADSVAKSAIVASLPVTRSGSGDFTDGVERLAGEILRLEDKGGERRGEHRVAWRLRANLYKHDPLDRKLPQTARIVEVVSMSANGAYISSSRVEATAGESYLFEITLPDFIFLVKGRVVWVNLANDVPERPRGFALRYEEMSRAPQQLLKHLIEADLVDSVLRQAPA